MASVPNEVFRSQLMERRQKLEVVRSSALAPGEIESLLQQVDSALERLDKGTYGLCEVCHEAVEANRLMLDPLTCYCLDHLNEAERRALQRDLDLATQIQTRLLPNREVRHGAWETYLHYQPAGPVSGDYCDLIPMDGDGGQLLFVAGDVSGKGVAASLLMSNLHAIFRSLHKQGLPLAELVMRANHVFCENTMSGFYATLLCGIADQDGEVEIVNAGHLPPMVLRDGKIETLPSTGLPLGLFCEARYQIQKVKMEQGDTLVFYTDGLTEARNGNDEEYGAERLMEALKACRKLVPQEVAKNCVAELMKFLAGRTLGDDLTLLVVRRATA